ncbi:MAG: right-handed parallel beta-helix repeat-containing protein [Conexivisphaerales archaeon]
MVQTPPSFTSTVSITNNVVSDYQKNGITCNDSGSSCTISGNTVSMFTPAQPYIAPNGIQIALGAEGSVSGNTIDDNVCTLASYCGSNLVSQSQGTGILVYDAGTSGVTISGNALNSNDIGIGIYLDKSGTVSPTSNTIDGGIYGLVLYDENETINGNVFSNMPTGIDVVADTSGITAIASGTDQFTSGVNVDCQETSVNGGIAICNITSAVPAGVPEFGPSFILFAVILALGLVIHRRLSWHGLDK